MGKYSIEDMAGDILEVKKIWFFWIACWKNTGELQKLNIVLPGGVKQQAWALGVK